MDFSKLQNLLSKHNIIVHELLDNNKASEKYVKTTYIQDDGFKWNTFVPYYSR